MAVAARRGPARLRIAGNRPEESGAVCSTMKIAAGSSCVNPATSALSASTPPADAPIVTMSCPRMRSKIAKVAPRVSSGDRWLVVECKRGGEKDGRRKKLLRGREPPPMSVRQNRPTAFDIVAVAASAGGLRALMKLLSALPSDFPAAVTVVQHLDPTHRSLMADILGRHSLLAVKHAEEDDLIQPGTVFVAPPDRHLLANADGRLSLSRTELVHFVRPSADLLFESVAASYKDRAIAVVLTGTGSDGAAGLQAVKKMGGTV